MQLEYMPLNSIFDGPIEYFFQYGKYSMAIDQWKGLLQRKSGTKLCAYTHPTELVGIRDKYTECLRDGGND